MKILWKAKNCRSTLSLDFNSHLDKSMFVYSAYHSVYSHENQIWTWAVRKLYLLPSPSPTTWWFWNGFSLSQDIWLSSSKYDTEFEQILHGEMCTDFWGENLMSQLEKLWPRDIKFTACKTIINNNLLNCN